MKIEKKKTKKKIFQNFFSTSERHFYSMKLIVNAQQKILRRLRYKNIYVDGQKKALRLSEG